MIPIQTIAIRSGLDVVTARMRVREAARHLGMSLTDQSRISLATSCLANALGLGIDNSIQGQITIEPVTEKALKGLRIVCTRFNCNEYVPPMAYFSNERWMVDEFEVMPSVNGNLEITLAKWMVI